MNGAELACGTCIKVEPSDPLYQLRKKKEEPNYYGNAGSASSETAMPSEALPVEDNAKEKSVVGVEEETNENGVEEGGGEDDLDDFFASL